MGALPNPPVPLPDKTAILASFKGKNVTDIQTPHLIIDRGLFVQNCEKMRKAVDTIGWDFRAHIKTHKTAEGARLQCQATNTSKIVVSTFPELQAVVDDGLISSGIVKDILYSMPLPLKLVKTIVQYKQYLEKHGANLRIMVDHPSQITRLQQEVGDNAGIWSIFLKLDIGSKRAGLPPQSDEMGDLIRAAAQCPIISIFGTYTHANFSYGAKNAQTAAEILALEVASANDVAKRVLNILQETGSSQNKLDQGGLRLAVGATPTAHAAHLGWEEAREKAGVGKGQLVGRVELHAGNYCLLDVQQVATSMVDVPACAMTVGATILSTYTDRNEAVCDAGAIAMSKDTGPFPGYGPVVSPSNLSGWSLGRNSQEHGILTGSGALPDIGEYVRIVPQHACLTAAQHPWFLIVEGGKEVVDVWIPVKGW